MKAYRIASGRRIFPFGDPARDLFIATSPLSVWQEQACRASGLELEDVASLDEVKSSPALAFYDDVFFTEMALRQLVADGRSISKDAAIALPSSPASRALVPLSDARTFEGGTAFDVFWLVSTPPRGESRLSLRARAAPHLIAIKERTIALRLPKADSASEAFEAPLTARVVAHVIHWIHVLRLSQLAIGVLLLDALRRDPWRILGLRLAARRGPWAVARRMCFVHPTAEVHPTADLEAAIIGAGSIVRAHAHVHSSVIGSGVEIGDHAVVVGSALADRVQVLRASYIALCAAMPAASLSSYKVQLSLFGRDVFLTGSALLLDAKLRGEIRVEHEGALFEIGTPFLGACLGHRVRIGAQVAVAPGRAIPNDVLLVGPPGQIAERFPIAGPGVFVVKDGAAVPSGDVPPSDDRPTLKTPSR
jgi:hypothetical protein